MTDRPSFYKPHIKLVPVRVGYVQFRRWRATFDGIDGWGIKPADALRDLENWYKLRHHTKFVPWHAQ